ncbi:hypothetical protein L210DRAFT_2377530 [Boletus edulis BED1]|uniref:PUB domain-containing protein n=1 Tax=Boletus edulis BED1 TaxID=1328754 RepID=A0AAD4C5Q6_BOLED|nr:hypothetical protein L210DRAFT_2377530 [Boletus edulis BED1]
MSSPTAQLLAEAAARRHAGADAGVSSAQLMEEHEKRQNLRRMIDPGIIRPNSRQVAMDSLKTLSTMAENILREPDNPKYQTFKHENDTIKRRLIQPKGALEYALALGFRPKVTGFQSHYVFNVSKMDDLRVGAAILKETLDREMEKEGRSQRTTEEQKAAIAAAAQNVKLAFLDDRQSKARRDARDRELREARESARGSQGASMPLAPSPPPDQTPAPMPGVGYTLATVDNPDVDQPPPYHD